MQHVASLPPYVARRLGLQRSYSACSPLAVIRWPYSKCVSRAITMLFSVYCNCTVCNNKTQFSWYVAGEESWHFGSLWSLFRSNRGGGRFGHIWNVRLYGRRSHRPHSQSVIQCVPIILLVIQSTLQKYLTTVELPIRYHVPVYTFTLRVYGLSKNYFITRLIDKCQTSVL